MSEPSPELDPECLADMAAHAYFRHISDIRRVAKALGYAIATHGSLGRDIDLIAVPWVEDAKPPEDLAEQIRATVGGHFSHSLAGQHLLANKSHGRLGCCINIGCGIYFDLSIMPLQPGAKA